MEGFFLGHGLKLFNTPVEAPSLPFFDTKGSNFHFITDF